MSFYTDIEADFSPNSGATIPWDTIGNSAELYDTKSFNLPVELKQPALLNNSEVILLIEYLLASTPTSDNPFKFSHLPTTVAMVPSFQQPKNASSTPTAVLRDQLRLNEDIDPPLDEPERHSSPLNLTPLSRSPFPTPPNEEPKTIEEEVKGIKGQSIKRGAGGGRGRRGRGKKTGDRTTSDAKVCTVSLLFYRLTNSL
jgi:hypothetical protein